MNIPRNGMSCLRRTKNTRINGMARYDAHIAKSERICIQPLMGVQVPHCHRGGKSVVLKTFRTKDATVPFDVPEFGTTQRGQSIVESASNIPMPFSLAIQHRSFKRVICSQSAITPDIDSPGIRLAIGRLTSASLGELPAGPTGMCCLNPGKPPLDAVSTSVTRTAG